MRTPLFSYNQRKHVEKHGFPLAIGTFCRYYQRKHIKKTQVSANNSFLYYQINQYNTMLRFSFATAVTVTVVAK